MKRARTAARGVSADTRIATRNKKAILEAAIGVFTKKGYDGASIAEIAKKSGLPKANVYYYFGSKETIYRTIIGDLIGEWDRALDQLTPERGRPTLSPATSAPSSTSRGSMLRNRVCSPTGAVHGGRFITRKDRAHMLAVTLEKVKVFETWMASGKMNPVDRSISSSCSGEPPSTMPTSTCWRRATLRRPGSAPTISTGPRRRSPPSCSKAAASLYLEDESRSRRSAYRR